MEISNIGVLFGASIGMFVIIGDVAPATIISLFALDWVSVITVDCNLILLIMHPTSVSFQFHCISAYSQSLSSHNLTQARLINMYNLSSDGPCHSLSLALFSLTHSFLNLCSLSYRTVLCCVSTL